MAFNLDKSGLHHNLDSNKLEPHNNLMQTPQPQHTAELHHNIDTDLDTLTQTSSSVKSKKKGEGRNNPIALVH